MDRRFSFPRCLTACTVLVFGMVGAVGGEPSEKDPSAAERAQVVVQDHGVGWSEIRFKARKFLLSASTVVSAEQVSADDVEDELRSLEQGPALGPIGDRVAVITLSTDLPFGRHEETSAWIDVSSGAALQSEKVKTGGRPYWKLRRYSADGYYQWRAEPAKASEKKLARDKWTRRSERQVSWTEPPPSDMVATDSYALLYLLSAHRLDREGAELKLCMSSRDKLVEVEFVAGEAGTRQLTFEEVQADGSKRRRQGSVRVRTVNGSGRLLGSRASDADVDLGFLGMQGEITVLLEEGTGLPVEVRGRTEDIGKLVVRLDQVTWRSPAGE